MDPSSPPGERCPDAMWEICGGSEALQGAVQVMALSSASACVDVGYLCAALETADSLQLWQWPESTRRLRVRVPLPSGLAPACARELQGAVVRGIQYWQRRPFELAIDTHPTPSVEVDIEISWEEGLSGSQIGLIHTKASLDQFEVLGITLATLSPNLKYGRTPEEVPLTAAHEMGHALGLPHSDSHRDVVYPTNTARSLTPRDFRTVEPLYRLPNGARIRRGP
ncbi:MAG: hypothetical protein CME12_04980 [Gemmatimonadetes bacterium]|nr:hypothetical protein [Gemmatimonadota bacterium]